LLSFLGVTREGTSLSRFAKVVTELGSEQIHDSAVRRVRGILYLDPVFALSGIIGAVKPLRDNAFEVYIAGGAQ
jgi:hypothetical protein